MKIAATFLIGTVAYLGAYVALLRPESYWFCSLGSVGSPYQREPAFRFCGDRAKTAFAPLLWMDQRIRPTYWAGVQLRDGHSVSGEEAQRLGLAQGGGFSGSVPSESSSSESAR